MFYCRLRGIWMDGGTVTWLHGGCTGPAPRIQLQNKENGPTAKGAKSVI